MAIVCICRGTQSGGRAMAQCLAERLGYPTLGREVVQEAAAGLGVPASLLEEKMGDRPTVWGRFSSLRRAYIAAVQGALAERAAEGRLVYHGLAGGMLLQGVPGTLCIRLIAPLERRIRAVMSDSGMDAVMAEQYIHEVDESRARWVRVMYGQDIMDPSLYDLVINLETMTVEGACALTEKVVGRPEFELTNAMLLQLEDFRLGCRVRVGLARECGSSAAGAGHEGGAGGGHGDGAGAAAGGPSHGRPHRRDRAGRAGCRFGATRGRMVRPVSVIE